MSDRTDPWGRRPVDFGSEIRGIVESDDEFFRFRQERRLRIRRLAECEKLQLEVEGLIFPKLPPGLSWFVIIERYPDGASYRAVFPSNSRAEVDVCEAVARDVRDRLRGSSKTSQLCIRVMKRVLHWDAK